MSNDVSPTQTITSQVPTDLARQIDDLAERIERPRTWVVRQALARYVAVEEQRHRMTLEALADVDGQRGVDHAQIEAWIDSLGTDTPLPTPSCD
jgi:predicted transcriptional regulator